MQFFTTIATVLTLAASTLAQSSGTAAYDTTYDTGSLSTLVIACSDGSNGLYTKGYQTLSQIPGYPYIGGSSEIAGWNSANCGKKYNVTYAATGKTITVTAVDVALGGWVLSRQGLDALTNNQAVQLGRVPVTWVPV